MSLAKKPKASKLLHPEGEAQKTSNLFKETAATDVDLTNTKRNTAPYEINL